jgi:hypothetical protein
MDGVTESLEEHVQSLRQELDFYKSLLFSNLNPQSASIINALRAAVGIQEENERLKCMADGDSGLRLLCERLEEENNSLRQMIIQHGLLAKSNI